MSEEYPEFIVPLSPYCLVRARVASIHADGPDDGSNPDWKPAVGQKVVFTPSISGQLLTYDAGTDDTIIVTVEPVEATTNADGWFVSNSGKRIYLLATDDPRLSVTGWTWSVNVNRRDIRFSAPSGGVVDLASFITAPAVDATRQWVERIPELVALLEAGSDPAVIGTIVADYLTANPPASDATTITKGVLRLAGDLGGTADAPTVPGLADKADVDHDHAISDVTGLQTELDGKQESGSYAAAAHDHDGTYAPALGPDDNYISDAEKAALHSHANKAALDEVSGVNTGDQDLSGYATTASLATVATSGAYADLTGTPTIPDSPDDIGAAPATHDHTAADIDSGAATDGHVLTADGAGGTAWEAPPAGGGIPPVPMIAGRWYNGFPFAVGPTESQKWLAGNGRMSAHLIRPYAGAITELGTHVLTPADGGLLHLGIYRADGPDGAPGTIVCASGAVDASTSGGKSGLVSAVLEDDWYWAVAHFNVDGIGTRSRGVSARYQFGSGLASPNRNTTLVGSRGFAPLGDLATQKWADSSETPHGIEWRYA